MKVKASSRRLQYLDWVRGIGAAIMLQGHVFDSFTRSDLRPGAAWRFSQLLGGMPPAIFLFLTGVTFAFLLDSQSRKPLSQRQRVWGALQRSGYLFLLAFAFRLWMWGSQIFAPWRDLFKVDILNCMGFSLAVMSLTAVFRTAQRARICAGIGLAVAFLSPVVSQMDWSRVPWMVRAYLIPDHNFFGFFPWGAYLVFGVAAGSAIRAIPAEAMGKAMAWTAAGAAAALAACHYCAVAPFSLYAKSDYWLDSPAQILTKMSVTFLLLAFAFAWTRYFAGEGWSWVRQFGTTSLLVYWVHIELVYGRWMWYFKDALNVPQTMVVAVFVILLMLGISTLRTYWREVRVWLRDAGWWVTPQWDEASGD